MTDFHGYPTAVLENPHLRLEYLTTAGPRIISLSLDGSPNILADVHDMVSDMPAGKFHFLGGHRLWTSPEVPEITYIPDDDGARAELIPGGVLLTCERGSVHKAIRLELDAQQPRVKLLHTITNVGAGILNAAPWALTMFRQGGTAILPQPVGNADPLGLLPNRLLVIWPYTRLNDPRLSLRDDFILLRAGSSLPPVKLGFTSQAGWMAYWLEGVLFCKTFDLHLGAPYPDGGCNAETYCGNRFIELETLGPLAALAPGQEFHLTETWDLYPSLDVPFIPEEIRKLL
jgi:hypothetical protein